MQRLKHLDIQSRLQGAKIFRHVFMFDRRLRRHAAFN